MAVSYSNFWDFVDQNREMLLKICRHVPHDEWVYPAEDLFGDTVIKIEKYLAKDLDRSVENPFGFFKASAINVARNYVRYKRTVLSLDDMPDKDGDRFIDTVEDKSQGPDQTCMNKLLIELFLAFPLKRRARDAIELSITLPVEEVAKILKIPEGTVKSTTFRGRAKLKKFFEQNGFSFR